MLPVAAELFHADGRTDGQTDMTKPTIAHKNNKKITGIPQEHKQRRLISFHRRPLQTKKYEFNQP
jgi:hypothetical protein